MFFMLLSALKQNTMKRIKQIPFGLGMGHIEQEIAACQVWNIHAKGGTNPGDWVDVEQFRDTQLFDTNIESGKSLENQGFIEFDGEGSFRLTAKAIELLEAEAEK